MNNEVSLYHWRRFVRRIQKVLKIKKKNVVQDLCLRQGYFSYVPGKRIGMETKPIRAQATKKSVFNWRNGTARPGMSIKLLALPFLLLFTLLLLSAGSPLVCTTVESCSWLGKM